MKEWYNDSYLSQISKKLIHSVENLATAESVTSGHLQAALSLAPNALDFFEGGITTYNLKQKSKILSVDPRSALPCDCVSQEVAIVMAKNTTNLFNSSWGIAVTGYASPVPEKQIEELFACYAMYNRSGRVESGQIQGRDGTPLEVAIDYTNQLLKIFLKLLS